MQFAYVLRMCILHICSMHINSTYAISKFALCAVCSYVTLMRDLHICSIIVKIYATYVLHVSIFVRVCCVYASKSDVVRGLSPYPEFRERGFQQWGKHFNVTKLVKILTV